MSLPLDPTIVVTRRWPAPVEEKLCATYRHVTLRDPDEPLGETGLREALASADVLLPCVSDRLSAEMLLAPEVRTRFIGNFGVGFSNIDIDAAREAGIVVTNTPGVLTDATADLAMTLVLMAARRTGEGERHVRDLAWTGWRPTHMMGGDVSGRTLGILGLGRIGRALARRAHDGFGMPVIWYDTHAGEIETGLRDARRAASVDEVLAEADFVSLHMPGGGDNNHLIGAAQLALMKPTAYLVNTARGDVVDQVALAAALRDGTIAGAGLDVFEHEPDVPEGLRSLENVVLLPHLGSATIGTRTAMGELVLQNLTCYLAGQEPPYRVA
jgi:lactate dehydrogenase-like 2-hydroxyacid dehydrogenase